MRQRVKVGNANLNTDFMTDQILMEEGGDMKMKPIVKKSLSPMALESETLKGQEGSEKDLILKVGMILSKEARDSNISPNKSITPLNNSFKGSSSDVKSSYQQTRLQSALPNATDLLA